MATVGAVGSREYDRFAPWDSIYADVEETANDQSEQAVDVREF